MAGGVRERAEVKSRGPSYFLYCSLAMPFFQIKRFEVFHLWIWTLFFVPCWSGTLVASRMSVVHVMSDSVPSLVVAWMSALHIVSNSVPSIC